MSDDIFQYPEKLKARIKEIVREGQDVSFEIVLAKFSYLPGVHKYHRYLYNTYREVVRELTGLCEDLVDHGRAKEALEDIETIIETDKLERRNKLQEEKGKGELIQKKQRVEGKRLDIEEAELDAALKAIKEPKEAAPPKSKEEQRQEEIERIKGEQAHQAEKEFVKQEGKLGKKVRIRQEREEKHRECDEKYKEDYGVEDVADLDDEATRKWKAERRMINNHYDKMGLDS
jgi:hypothetical protein